MSQRYGRKIAGKRGKKDESEAHDFQTFGGFSKNSDEPFGVREGGDGQASPVNEWPDISDESELPLTIHSVPVGGVDKSRFGNELGGITDRIAKLLHEYEAVYDDESSQGLVGASVTGQSVLHQLVTE
ncbi:uncharacterized protein LOC116295326 [Actinia tenebrosa]|uniref:Uncharacterized protein LOC116295326 n=1 Tax=Actinia tenebrosa TaxID=6105 RepID=A0A6P8HU88_ACTTE|nr:uncharacterized protein LOC116295326 [Actinia tenebrosa]